MTQSPIQSAIARAERKLRDIETKYQGVRPSWVSTEIAIIMMQIDKLKEQLDE